MKPELETEPNRAVGRRRRASAIAGVSIAASSPYLRVSIHSGTVTRSSAPPPLLATRAASPARGLPLRPAQRGPAARALSARGLPPARLRPAQRGPSPHARASPAFACAPLAVFSLFYSSPCNIFFGIILPALFAWLLVFYGLEKVFLRKLICASICCIYFLISLIQQFHLNSRQYGCQNCWSCPSAQG
jgi:hypothetical protein